MSSSFRTLLASVSSSAEMSTSGPPAAHRQRSSARRIPPLTGVFSPLRKPWRGGFDMAGIVAPGHDLGREGAGAFWTRRGATAWSTAGMVLVGLWSGRTSKQERLAARPFRGLELVRWVLGPPL